MEGTKKGVPFLSKMLNKRVEGLDLDSPCKKLRLVPRTPPPPPRAPPHPETSWYDLPNAFGDNKGKPLQEKTGAWEGDTRAPVLSFAHYLQAPSSQARKPWALESQNQRMIAFNLRPYGSHLFQYYLRYIKPILHLSLPFNL